MDISQKVAASGGYSIDHRMAVHDISVSPFRMIILQRCTMMNDVVSGLLKLSLMLTRTRLISLVTISISLSTMGVPMKHISQALIRELYYRSDK